MIISPIIPIWLMGIICVVLLVMFRSKNKYTLIRQIIILSLLFIINLRFMYLSKNAKVQAENLDIDVIFVIDTTVSMLAEDYNGNTPRLDAIKENCNYMIDKLEGAKFSIITFNNNSQIVIPLTKDSNIAKEAITCISVVNNHYAQGTSLDTPLENLENTLKRAYEKDESRQRIVFYISDGEVMGENSEIGSFKSCKKYIDNGAVLGYGTSQGGKMKVEDYYGNKTYVTYTDEKTYETIDGVSKIDEDNLKQIAKDIGIDYIKIDKKKDINEKIEEIIEKANKEISDDKKSLYTDIYYLFMIPLIGMLAYEYINYRRKL